MKTPEELNQNVKKYYNDQTKEALGYIVDILITVENYIEEASKIGRKVSYLHLEHRNSKAKKIAINIVYDYLEKKGYRVDRTTNKVFWS
ncbi:MAG: hypothetical protein ACSHW7_01800 [Patiriisocius sp.]|uniref:hypothetical protein n=1 Tax=Patiriisocius sp. TaxID=2822396 RepID=UPI003EF5B9ED